MTKSQTSHGKFLVFVCSGAADVGELTDCAARHIRQEGLADMSCLASIAACNPDILFNTDLAERVLLIDGCPKACARRTFELAKITRFSHFDLSELGFIKGKSKVTEERIRIVARKAAEMLTA